MSPKTKLFQPRSGFFFDEEARLKDVERFPRTNSQAIRILVLASVLLIFATTLFPFNFGFRGSILRWNALALPSGKEGEMGNSG
jgi:hypothetical protein